jgi:hypothetical protein
MWVHIRVRSVNRGVARNLALTAQRPPYTCSLDVVKATKANGGLFPQEWLNVGYSRYAAEGPALSKPALSKAAAAFRQGTALHDSLAQLQVDEFSRGYGPIACFLSLAVPALLWTAQTAQTELQLEEKEAIEALRLAREEELEAALAREEELEAAARDFTLEPGSTRHEGAFGLRKC